MKNVESNRRFDVTKIASRVVLATTAAAAAWSFAPGTKDNHLTPVSEQQQVKLVNTPEGGVVPPSTGASPIVVETATSMPSATAVIEAPTEVSVDVPTEAPVEVPTEIPTVAPTATIEAKPTQEKAKQGELGSFEINGKKVIVSKVTEIPDRNDLARKTVSIMCLPSADFTNDISNGGWTLNLGTDSGQFPAILSPVVIDLPIEVNGKLTLQLGKLIEASIPADINTYSLLVTHDLGTVQDANGGVGGASSYALPLRQENLLPDGK